jgi:hypothetical protein
LKTLSLKELPFFASKMNAMFSMNTILRQLCFLFLLICLTGFNAVAQKRTMGYPESFEDPLDPFDQNKYETFIRGESIKDKIKNRAWWVVVDRDNVKAYDKPNGNIQTSLKFASAYYVTDEEDDWVELIDATVDKLEIKKVKSRIGWVKKNDLLLWNRGLINPRTKIHLKALLLNKFDDFKDIPCDKKELVKVYTSPTGSNLKDNLNIYKFYFVYKKEGTRYLLGETSQLSIYEPAFLLGWVDKGRVADWNTRIALEPNFTQEGYNERKNNLGYQVVGFGDAPMAEEFGQGKVTQDKGDWHRDPAKAGQEVASSDPKRFPGGFMRFPLLSVGGQTKKSVLPYFKSAVCDNVALKVKCQDGKAVSVKQMTIGKHVSIAKQLESYTRASKYFNVFFVIEGSGAMSGFKENIISAIDEVKSAINSNSEKPVIRFGALVYKDVAELKGNANPQTLFKVTKLTADQQSVKDWIRNTTFSNPNSSGEYPIQNYGLYKAIEAAEFPKFETNIIIVLGQKGDFTKDALMRKQHAGKSYNVPNASIEDLIVKNDINVLAVQCIGGNAETDRAFTSNIQSLILESAKKHYNNLYLKKDLNPEVKQSFAKLNYNPKVPIMDDPDETKDPLLVLENGTLNSCIFRAPGSTGAITQETFVKLLSSQGGTITKVAVEFTNDLDSWNYREIDGQGFNPKLGEVLVELYDDLNLDDSFTEEKYELYKPMYFSRQPQGATNPTFSFVLFWPQRDLTKYNSFLEKLLVDVSNLSTGQKRIKLQEAYCKLLDEFAGGENGKDCTEYTIEEIVELIQGVKGEGIDFNSKCIKDKTLKCLTDTKCTTDDEVEQLIYCFTSSKKVLDKMLKNYENEEFVFSRGGEYFFWIKLTDLF